MTKPAICPFCRRQCMLAVENRSAGGDSNYQYGYWCECGYHSGGNAQTEEEALKFHNAFGGPSDQRMVTVERAHIEGVLLLLGGNKAKAAKVLGIDRRTLYRRLMSYRIGGA